MALLADWAQSNPEFLTGLVLGSLTGLVLGVFILWIKARRKTKEQDLIDCSNQIEFLRSKLTDQIQKADQLLQTNQAEKNGTKEQELSDCSNQIEFLQITRSHTGREAVTGSPGGMGLGRDGDFVRNHYFMALTGP